MGHYRCALFLLQAVQDGEDLRFTFERAEDETPYWQQGDAGFYTKDALAMRAALKYDARVQQELERFWQVYDKDESGRITKAEYLKVHCKIGLVLIPDVTPEEALVSGEEDWKADTGGQDTMGKEELCNCLFELADMVRGHRRF